MNVTTRELRDLLKDAPNHILAAAVTPHYAEVERFYCPRCHDRPWRQRERRGESGGFRPGYAEVLVAGPMARFVDPMSWRCTGCGAEGDRFEVERMIATRQWYRDQFVGIYEELASAA